MTEKDIKTICLKLESLHTKILESKFAEQVYESEMMSLILAIGELEKQIPKKPKVLKVHDISNYKYGYCECGESICDVDNYCSKCGQALDWSDTE